MLFDCQKIDQAIQSTQLSATSLSQSELRAALVASGLSSIESNQLVTERSFQSLDLTQQGKVEKQMLIDSLHTFAGDDPTYSPRVLSAGSSVTSPQDTPPKRVVRSSMHALHIMYNSGALPDGLLIKNVSEMKSAFENLDTDKSGYLDYQELQVGLERLGAGLNDAELNQLWRLMAQGGNGPHRFAKGIRYEAFATAVSQYKVFEAAVKQICDALRTGERKLFGHQLKSLEDVFTSLDTGGSQRFGFSKQDGQITLVCLCCPFSFQRFSC